jgi:hypothetical protein
MESNTCPHKYLEELEIGLCCLSCGALRNFIPETPDTPTTSSINSNKEYEYPLLNPDLNEIRLIELLPGEELEPISCRITAVELGSIDFSAVSYTWATEDGDASKTKSIQVYTNEEWKEKRYIKVTANCENALRQLRHERTENSARMTYPMIWIDSICINQERISERNQQVSIMDRIYKSAVHVDICIQASGQDYRGAMELLNHSINIGQDFLVSAMDSLANSKSFKQYASDKDQIEHELHLRLMQLSNLFSLRYFGRVWVVQEVLLAQKVFMHVNREVVQLKEGALRYICDSCTTRSISIPWLSRWVTIWTRAPDMIMCLNMSLSCSASDLRDQVFAITGLLRPCTRALIPIDYISSIEEVFATAVSACIAECGYLDVLRHAQLPKDADLRTTPSLGIAQLKTYLTRQCSRGVYDRPQMWQQYRMTQSYKPWIPRVVLGAACNHCKLLDHHDVSRPIECALQQASSELAPSSTFYPLKRPLPKGQMLPHLRVQAYPIDTCRESTNQSLADFVTILEAGVHSRHQSWILDLVREPYEESLRDLITDFQTTGNCMWTSEGYTVFRTRYSVGFTSGHCQPGDIVVLIDGTIYPFLLRGIRDREYRIVGACHIWNTKEVMDLTQGSVGKGRSMDFEGQKRFIEIY